MTHIQSYDARIHHPSTILISGPSGAGKTNLTKCILQHAKVIFRPESPKHVVLVYDVWQNIYQYLVDNGLVHQTLKGLGDIEYLKEVFEEHKDIGGTLLIIDDQMPNIDQNIVNIFTIYSHHLNVTCLLLTQSLFLSSREYRTLSLNSHYIILMKNSRDSSSVTQLAKQTHPYRLLLIL